MPYIIAGLGNPGDEFADARHNAGRDVVLRLGKKMEVDWKFNKNHKALEAKGKIGKENVLLSLPETFMNNSGKAIAPLVKNIKGAEKLVVVHDDIDLPFGSVKIVFNRGDGGHNGVASVIKAIKTKTFVRIRVGVAPVTPSGKMRKPTGEEAVIKFILGKFAPAQEKELKKIIDRAVEAARTIIEKGKDRAMNIYN